MNNSLLMMTTTTSNSILSNGTIPLNTITRRRSNTITSNNNSILLNRVGYYKVNASVTFNSTATGVATIKAQKNGVDLTGMTASTTITTATTEFRTLNISGIVRVTCGEGFGTLTLVNSGIAITTNNVEIDVEYLG